MGMIAFLRGTVAESYPQRLILDVHGVGYEVIVPLSTFDRLNPLPGRELTLKTYLHVRENMQVLYGFCHGCGAGHFPAADRPRFRHRPCHGHRHSWFPVRGAVQAAVVSGDVSGIARAKGVGKKTAERIVLELKDKVGLAATWEAPGAGATSQAAGDAELALIALGFKQVESRKAIAAHLKDHPDADAGRTDPRRPALHELTVFPTRGPALQAFDFHAGACPRAGLPAVRAGAGAYCHDGGTIVLTAG